MNKTIAEFIKKNVGRWRNDPAFFVRQVLRPGKEITDQQMKLLEAIAQPGAKVSVKSGHGTGKTTCCAWLIIWFLMCYSPAKISVTAPTSAQLKDALWAELKLWWGKLPPELHDIFDWTSDHFTNRETGSFALARTASKEKPEALQGVHADNVLFIIDEASGVYDEVFMAAGSTLSADNARVVMASNPTQVTGYFYNSHNANRNLWTRLTFNGEESPMVSKAYCESIENEFGRDSDVYRVRVLGDFPLGSEYTFITRDIVDKAVNRYITKEQFSFAPVILGVDPAYSGKDEFVIYMRQGVYSKLLYHTQKSDDTVRMAQIIADFQDKYGAQAVFIDAGYGTGIKDIGVNMGRNWQLVWFGGKAKLGYANKRAEIWGAMKQWLIDGGVIENNETLISDLISIEGGPNKMGNIQLEPKSQDGKKSPDYADALACTFAFPVAINNLGTRRTMCNTDYDFY